MPPVSRNKRAHPERFLEYQDGSFNHPYDCRTPAERALAYDEDRLLSVVPVGDYSYVQNFRFTRHIYCLIAPDQRSFYLRPKRIFYNSYDHDDGSVRYLPFWPLVGCQPGTSAVIDRGELDSVYATWLASGTNRAFCQEAYNYFYFKRFGHQQPPRDEEAEAIERENDEWFEEVARRD